MNSPWSFDGDGTLLSGRRWVVYACPDCAEPEGAVSGRRARAASTHNGATTPGEPHRAWPPQTDTDPAWAHRGSLRGDGGTRGGAQLPLGPGAGGRPPHALCGHGRGLRLEERVAAVSHSFADPTPYVAAAHAAGVKVLVQVQTVAQAVHAAHAGVDVIAAQGTEAGGHTGTTSATLPLVPAVVDAVGAGRRR